MSLPNGIAGLAVIGAIATACGGSTSSPGAPPDTAPPAVAITFPASGATVAATIAVAASVADDYGVAEVSLELDGSQTGHTFVEGPAGVYTTSVDTRPLSNATHAIRVCALDTSANSACSAAVAVTVANVVADTVPPSVSVSSPASGATLAGTLAVAASVEDDRGVAEVVLVVDDAQTSHAFAEGPSGVYTTSLDTTALARGGHELRVCASDPAGNAACSPPVPVTVLNPVSCSSPWVPNEDASACVCPAGSHEDGGTCVPDVVPDTRSPYVQIATPEPGAVITGPFVVAASAQDDRGIAGVVMTMDGTATYAMSLDPVLRYSTYAIDSTQLANGSHTFQVCATDTSGNVGCARTSVTAFVSNCPATFVPSPDYTACVCPEGQHEAAGVCVPLPDTAPPVVFVTAPLEGATVSGLVNVQASVLDDRGVADVILIVDGVQREAPATESPAGVFTFTLQADSLGRGAHAFEVCAADTSANTACSGATRVTVYVPDTSAPQVALVSPVSGATVSGVVALVASAADDVAIYDVWPQSDGFPWDGPFVEGPAGVYTTTFDSTKVANGGYWLQACARDTSFNQTCTDGVRITIDNVVPDTTPPVVSIVAPRHGDTVSGLLAVTAGVADDGVVAAITLAVDDVVTGAAFTAAGDGVFGASVDTTALDRGLHTLRVCATDASANVGCSAVVAVTVFNPVSCTPPFVPNGDFTACVCPEGYHVEGDTCARDPDTTAPTVAITAPADGATVAGTIAVTATVSDDRGVASVELLLNAAASGASMSQGPADVFSTPLDTLPLQDGPHALQVCAVDTSGNAGCSAVITLTVLNPDVTPPEVSFAAPADGGTVAGRISVTFRVADDEGVSSVSLTRDRAQAIEPVVESTPGVYSAELDTLALLDGSHVLSACASDASGNAACAEITVTVENAAQWRVVPYPAGFPADARTVWGTGPSDVWIGAHDPNGGSGTAVSFAHWNGSTWTTHTTSPAFYPNAMSGSGPSDVWAAGEGGRVAQWNGSGWSSSWVYGSTFTAQQNAIWVGSPSDRWVFGTSLWVFHWTGSSWQSLQTNTAHSLRGGGVSFGGYVWGAGDAGVVLRCTPASCSAGGYAGDGPFYDVWGTASNDYWVVGYWNAYGGGTVGAIRHETNGGPGWDWVASGADYCLTDLWGSASNDVWAVGLGGTIWHWDGSGLTRTQGVTSATLTDVWGSGPNDVWAVGNGVVLHYSP